MEYYYHLHGFLSTHSDICVSSGLVFVDWFFSPPKASYFGFFACLIIFYWISDIMNFTLLDIGYLFILTNILFFFLIFLTFVPGHS